MYQTLETVFQRLSKNLEFCQKINTPLHVVFSTIFSVFGYPDETLSLVFDNITSTGYKVKDMVSHNLQQFVSSMAYHVNRDWPGWIKSQQLRNLLPNSHEHQNKITGYFRAKTENHWISVNNDQNHNNKIPNTPCYYNLFNVQCIIKTDWLSFKLLNPGISKPDDHTIQMLC